MNKRIDVDYMARTEGEAAIRIELEDQPAIVLKIFEPPRFFEGFLAGRRFDEVGDIVSRICGICPVSHMSTAILAIEKAMQIRVSEQTGILRNLMCSSQIAASHLIHLYMLAMPDYYGKNSITELLPDFQKQTDRLIKMKEILNGLTGLIGGRALHPVTFLPGGFTKIPEQKDFDKILKQFKEIQKDAKEVVLDISRFKVPDFYFKTEYVCLDKKDGYAIDEGRIISDDGLNISVDDYYDHFEESEVDYAFAKRSRIKGRNYFMVGALARINLKYDKLQTETKKMAKEIGFAVPNYNPYLNNLAQSLEVFDLIQHCIKILETNKFKHEDYSVKIKEGDGGAMTEAPRGLLYHWYKIDSKGIVAKANIITPTSHNFLNIEESLKKMVKENLNKPRNDIRLMAEMLVRAYDPCFSCSVH
ncbi:MAG: Ni/Fe hydrogenase subunit alpha [Proteobacteria bacterium]|nr:Ni/Fe hydrogenase subunit alpha [Pseudomonadota bacterium]